jgi:2-dehydropantoate 2-reductase
MRPVHHEIVFSTFEVLDSVAALSRSQAERPFDMMFLAVSGTALHDEEWLSSLRDAVGPDVPVFATSGGLDGPERLHRAGFAADKVLHCGLTIISWQAPLEGEAVEAHNADDPVPIHYYPGGSSPVSGADGHAVRSLVSALQAGGMAAHAAPVGSSQNFAILSAVLTSILVLLEAEDWSFARFGASPDRQLCCDAAGQSFSIVTRTRFNGHQPWMIWFFRRILMPLTLWLAVALAPHIFPFPIEAYLQYHFTKVGDQTQDNVDSFVRMGKDLNLPVDRIEALASRNPRWRRQE